MKELIIIILTILGLFSCKPSQGFCIKGEGNVTSRNIELTSFDQISIECSADVQLRYGAEQSVEVQGQANIIDQLSLEVVSGKWKIDFEKSVCMNKEFVIYITVPSIEAISINGSGDVSGKSTFNQDEFDLNINGSGDVSIDVNAEEIDININGSGDISLSGKAKSLEIEIDGSGDVSAYNLMVENCSVDVNGSGDSQVNVNGYLTANINGSGDISYKGKVEKVDISESGSGDVYRK